MTTEGKLFKLKVILLGDAGVGKTSITLRFTANNFDPIHKSTLGGKVLFLNNFHMRPPRFKH